MKLSGIFKEIISDTSGYKVREEQHNDTEFFLFHQYNARCLTQFKRLTLCTRPLQAR